MKWVSPGLVGVPDRLLLCPGGRIVFVELKTVTGRPTQAQVRMQATLRSLGFDARIVYGLEQGLALLDEMLGGVVDVV